MNYMSRDKQLIVREFNKQTNDLIKLFELTSNDEVEQANLDRLRKRISLLKTTLGENRLIELAAPVFINISEEITERNEQFFMNVDARAEFNKKYSASSEDEFMFLLVDSARSLYNRSPKADKDYIYNSILLLYRNAIEYCI